MRAHQGERGRVIEPPQSLRYITAWANRPLSDGRYGHDADRDE